jgi:hypothetical protein
VAEEALVAEDIEAGRRFVELLDRSGTEVKGAFWLYQPDAERWRLVIVTPQAARGSKDLYLKAIREKADIDLARVDFQPPSSSVFKALGGLIKVDGLGAMRMQRNAFNGVYIEDALVYRLAA